MYDAGRNPDEPEQSIAFSGINEDETAVSYSSNAPSAQTSPSKKFIRKKNLKGVFGIDLDEFEAVSFAFGNSLDDVGWSRFAVYGLMKSGDVFAFAPFVPHKL
jgi:hypothetical protein